MARVKATKRRKLTSARVTPSGFKRPVEAIPRPRPHMTFSLNSEHSGAEPLEDDEAQRVRAEIDDADALGREWIPIGHPVSARQASGDHASVPCRARTGSDLS